MNKSDYHSHPKVNFDSATLKPDNSSPAVCSSSSFGQDDCCVCLDKKVDLACELPCGHVSMCADCTSALAYLPRRNRCPMCRAPYLKRKNSLEIVPEPSQMYLRLRDNFLAQRSTAGPVLCPCSAVMAKLPSVEAHAGCPVECDVCHKVCRGTSLVYHCPVDQHHEHPFGFDLCKNCAFGTPVREFRQRVTCFGRLRRQSVG
eukprot:GEMP01055118.1.p1 GENE.GEMP01055118.1~~GEMP01055118.1.p1  ORF type:complete len:202 (+),score=26.70 GEMP01055118.1:34-639(+)